MLTVGHPEPAEGTRRNLSSNHLSSSMVAWCIRDVLAGAGASVAAALLAELLLSFSLCHTVLHVATAPSVEGNSYFGARRFPSPPAQKP